MNKSSEMTVSSAVAERDGVPPVPAPRRIELYPNCSLTPRSAAVFLLATGGVTLLVAAFFALKGLWPILPFAGLEVGLLTWATLHSMRRGQEREILEIGVTAIVIESRRIRTREITVFPRHWAEVKLHAPQHALHPSRLTIEWCGRAREVGRFLTEDERRGLAARLKQLIGKVNESPALRPDRTP